MILIRGYGERCHLPVSPYQFLRFHYYSNLKISSKADEQIAQRLPKQQAILFRVLSSDRTVDMKFKYTSALISTLIISAATALPALASTGIILVSPDSKANIRDEPSTNSRIRHYGVGGDQVNILNQTNAPDGFTWYFIEFPNSGARGWIRGDLLALNGQTGERVSFAPGSSAANVGGRVQGGQSRTYVLNAKAGQTLSTSITGTSQFLQVLVFAPNGTNLYTGARNWSGVLPSTGDYRLQVRLVPEEQKPEATGEYSLTIAIR